MNRTRIKKELIYPDFKITDEMKKNMKSKDSIVISSGGLYIFNMMGLFAYIQKMNILPKYKWVIGTSAGSIIGLILVTDLDFEDLFIDFCFDFIPLKFLKPNIKSVYTFITKSYINKESKIKKQIITDIIKKKYNRSNMSFIELYNKSEKIYIVTVTNINKANLYYLSYITTPDLSIVESINASSQIPFAWPPLPLNILGNKDDYYVDGAITNTFPIDIFLDGISNFCFNNYVPEDKKLKLPTLESGRIMCIKVYDSNLDPNYQDNVLKTDIPFIVRIIQILNFITYGQNLKITDEWLKQTIILKEKKPLKITENITLSKAINSYNIGIQTALKSLTNFKDSNFTHF